MPSDKRKLRKDIRQKLAGLTNSYITKSSNELSAILIDWLNDKPDMLNIALYAALPSEANLRMTTQLLPKLKWHYPFVSHKTMSFHRVSNPDSLKKGFSDIFEPNPKVHPPVITSELDLIICPGLGFTQNGYRIGRGGGFYDRFLSTVPDIPRMGVSLAEQLYDSLPHGNHDIQMNYMLTPDGIHSTETQSVV